MPEKLQIKKKMKVFPKGQVVIPIDLRKKFNINIGDQIEFITFKDGIMLKPSKQKPNKEKSLVSELFGTLNSYAQGREMPTRSTIYKLTESNLLGDYSE
jgi:AbrB family looped-hinge helix DNA binding protein